MYIYIKEAVHAWVCLKHFKHVIIYQSRPHTEGDAPVCYLPQPKQTLHIFMLWRCEIHNAHTLGRRFLLIPWILIHRTWIWWQFVCFCANANPTASLFITRFHTHSSWNKFSSQRWIRTKTDSFWQHFPCTKTNVFKKCSLSLLGGNAEIHSFRHILSDFSFSL